MIALRMLIVVVIAVTGLSAAGCSGSRQALDCPEARPVEVMVPVPIKDGRVDSIRVWLQRQQPSTMLSGLDPTTTLSDSTIAVHALIDLAWYKRAWRDLLRFMERTDD